MNPIDKIFKTPQGVMQMTPNLTRNCKNYSDLKSQNIRNNRFFKNKSYFEKTEGDGVILTSPTHPSWVKYRVNAWQRILSDEEVKFG